MLNIIFTAIFIPGKAPEVYGTDASARAVLLISHPTKKGGSISACDFVLISGDIAPLKQLFLLRFGLDLLPPGRGLNGCVASPG